MTRFEDGIPSASCSEMSYDPYGDVPAEYMNPPPLTLPQHIQVRKYPHQHTLPSHPPTHPPTQQRQQMPQQQQQQHMHMQSTSHMPYGNYAPQQNTIQQQQQPQAPPQQQPQQMNYVNIVHPSGRTVWVQVREGATLAQVKEDACRQLGLAEIGPMTRVTPMLDEVCPTPMPTPYTNDRTTTRAKNTQSAVDRQCMPNDTLYILPTTAANKPQELPSLYHEASQPVTPLVPSMPTTPLSAMSGSFTSAMYAAPHPTYSNSTPLSAAAPCMSPLPSLSPPHARTTRHAPMLHSFLRTTQAAPPTGSSRSWTTSLRRPQATCRRSSRRAASARSCSRTSRPPCSAASTAPPSSRPASACCRSSCCTRPETT